MAQSEDHEADDLLGSYAAVESEAKGNALILTGDRDMFQCVNKKVKVLYVRTGSKGAQLVDEAEVEARYGIPPKLVPDFIALRGDPSDGIPGAKGVGEKTAASVLRRHGSLEGALTGKLAAVADELRDLQGHGLAPAASTSSARRIATRIGWREPRRFARAG